MKKTKKITSHPIVKNGHNIVLAVASILLIAALFYAAFFAADADNAMAGTTHNVSGWAWSENIGWISFNCTDTSTCATVDYGVNIAANGDLSGYAWSENIGWITFNQSDLSGCPSGTCKAKLFENNLQGWARALSYGDGWDGWISLNGTNYGPIKNGNNLEGYAWDASDINGQKIGIGWIDFSPALGGGVIINPDSTPTVTLSADPPSVLYDEDSTLTWSTSNATSCEASGGWSGSKPLSGSEVVGPHTVDTDYSITCTNAISQVSPATITVTVDPDSVPKVDLTADTPIPPGETSTLTWSTSNVDSCEASIGWSGSKPLSGSEVVGPLILDTVYRLTCTTTASQAIADTETVFILVPPEPPCSDNNDNDLDTLKDDKDPGCYDTGGYDPDDDNETDTLFIACSNNFDDDGDGLVDFDGGGVGDPDPGCSSENDNREFNIWFIEF